ncbi:MAG: hypothetical protein SO046_09810 [Actinomyces urogenitalis]|uniref:Trm112 family protein n=1 Tax=Actinomyces urogenitalis TaxID=103621 RepID=UPI00242CEDF0|nr:hypothetical protein [Actinomyces urogenitalis]MCI7457524.1 hypothetical protein [Actinomyces urogenitalis]MDY3679492.1 hypothetical protein [Actinomyces urogenitalis]
MSTQPWTPVDGSVSGVDAQIRALLRCPVTGEELVDVRGPSGEVGLASRGGGLVYPVRDGVPILLAHEASPLEN